MNRDDFKNLSQMRVGDAQALFSNRRYQGAYYLAGYAVECALKACIAKKTAQFDFPLGRNQIDKIYVHNLTTLRTSAGLDDHFSEDSNNNPDLIANWNIVKDWKEDARYKQERNLPMKMRHSQ